MSTMLLIVAMPMDDLQVDVFISPSQIFGKDVVDFQHVSIFEKQVPERAMHSLVFEKPSQEPFEHGMFFQAF